MRVQEKSAWGPFRESYRTWTISSEWAQIGFNRLSGAVGRLSTNQSGWCVDRSIMHSHWLQPSTQPMYLIVVRGEGPPTTPYIKTTVFAFRTWWKDRSVHDGCWWPTREGTGSITILYRSRRLVNDRTCRVISLKYLRKRLLSSIQTQFP